LKLKALSAEDYEQVRQWRNECLPALRTPFLLTAEQQEQFYREVVCSRQANARYWGVWNADLLIGMAGLEGIQWENRLAEISLLLNPEYPMDKYGEEALKLLLHEGFMNLNLENIFTEVYACSPAFDFWLDIAEEYDCSTAILPGRKYHGGYYWDSLYINFEREDFSEYENLILEPAQAVN